MSLENISVYVLECSIRECKYIFQRINRYVQMKCPKSWTGQCETWMSVWVPSALHSDPWGQCFRARSGGYPIFLLCFPLDLARKGWAMWEALSTGSEVSPVCISLLQKQHKQRGHEPWRGITWSSLGLRISKLTYPLPSCSSRSKMPIFAATKNWRLYGWVCKCDP